MNDKRLDPVSESIAESFPASDPPSWTMSGVGSPHQSLSPGQATPAAARADENRLPSAIGRLERLLEAGRPGGEAMWLQRAASELQHVVSRLQEHARAANAADGIYAEVDMTRPSLARIVEQLKKEHTEFSSQAEALAERASENRGEGQEELSLRYVQLREQVQSLLQALRRHQADEQDIALDTVNMDFGAGD